MTDPNRHPRVLPIEDGEPAIGGLEPVIAELEQGQKYTWCQCGRSSEQPWCDGFSHLGSAFNGQVFTAQRSGMHRLCTCKRTKRPPYCDDSHRMLTDQCKSDQ